MKSNFMFTIAGVSMLAGALLAPQLSVAAGEARTPEQCASLFNQLNTSGTGKLTASEAAADPSAAKAFSDPQVQQKGYLTREEFTPLCTGENPQKGADQQKAPTAPQL